MNVSLTPELEKYVHDKVSSGGYASASEVVREALRERQEREAKRTTFVAELRAKLTESKAQLARGEFTEGTPDELKRVVRQRAAAQKRERDVA